MRKKTIEQFISTASKIHDQLYDYSNSIYKGSDKKIDIICPIHGKFSQIPNDHLKGYGCSKCGRISQSQCMALSKEEFLEKALKIHSNRYDYSNVKYINGKTKIGIICRIHGDFFKVLINIWNRNQDAQNVIFLKDNWK